jgi:hypothetical protein
MARISDAEIPWYVVRALEKSARLGGAADIYSDLASPQQLADTRARRNQFAADMRSLRRAIAQGVSEDEPSPAPRRQTSDQQKAYALWGRQQQAEAEADAWDAAREAFRDVHMHAIGFERTRR